MSTSIEAEFSLEMLNSRKAMQRFPWFQIAALFPCLPSLTFSFVSLKDRMK